MLNPSDFNSFTSTLNDAGTFGSLIVSPRMIDSYAAARPIDVVGFDGEHFLERVARAIAFQCPHFHFAEALSAELRLAAERLLGDQRVRTDGAHVRLVLHEVVQLQHVDLPDHHAVLERLARAAVEEFRLAVLRQARPSSSSARISASVAESSPGVIAR